VTRAAWFPAVAVASLLLASAPAARADDADARANAEARSHYEMGVKLFEARENEQALIEFSKANEIKSRPAAIFMMAQAEYLLGRLKDARAHYQQYIDVLPDGEFHELARDRIESINKRKSTFAINTVPDDVTIRLAPEGKPGEPTVTGQAPNNFSISPGRYRIDVTKPNFQGQTRVVEIDIAETKPLFFKLEPIPARLEIETAPPWANLYVNGNRAQNPYRQNVAPGHVEIFAEASDYHPRTLDLELVPGERRLLTGTNLLRLPYKERSGRTELLVASAVVGGLVGAGAVAAAIGSHFDDQGVSSLLFTTGGAIAGGIAGALVATPLVPQYIPDNRALFILGGMWIGAAEGAGVGIVTKQIVTASGTRVDPCPGPVAPCRGPIGDQLRAGFIGSLPGITVGLTTSGLAGRFAPSYGRVAMIQSATLGGAMLGAVGQLAFQWKPYGTGWEYTVRQPPLIPNSNPPKPDMTGTAGCTGTDDPNELCAYGERSVLDLAPGALIGLNIGLTAGLLAAYLPDQSRSGPTAQRVLLVDLATAAGAVAGGTFGCVAAPACLNSGSSSHDSDMARATAAWAALGGAAVGAIGGVLLTRHFDDDRADATPSELSTVPVATVAPVRDAAGNMAPGFAAMGFF
jgi:hypothetical protein